MNTLTKLVIGTGIAVSALHCDNTNNYSASQPTTREVISKTMPYFHFKETEPKKITYNGKTLLYEINEVDNTLSVAGFIQGDYKTMSKSGTPVTQVRPVPKDQQDDITAVFKNQSKTIRFWDN